MRTTYLVAYDICDAKRLRRVFKTCRDYGEHLQYSVFECDLSPRELAELEGKLTAILKHDEDQVLFITLGPAETRGQRAIHSLGLAYTKLDAPCYSY